MDAAWRRRRGLGPPILTLLDLFEEHRGAFEYDWRQRFGKSLAVVGTRKMSWGEAWRLTSILLGDTSSQIAAALAGWQHPIDRTGLILMDLYDLQHMSKSSKKVKPYPRPWPLAHKTTTAPDKGVTQEQILAALRFAGHTGPVPGEVAPKSGRARDARGRFVKAG